jgi:hypothetical protein
MAVERAEHVPEPVKQVGAPIDDTAGGHRLGAVGAHREDDLGRLAREAVNGTAVLAVALQQQGHRL